MTVYACPMPDCDTFPYDTAQELTDHLLSHAVGTPAPWSAPQPVTPALPATPDPAMDAIRSFSPGGTRAKGAPVVMATKAQLNYLDSLLTEFPGVIADFGVDRSQITRAAAGKALDALTKERDRVKAERLANPAAQPAANEVPTGLHLLDGNVFKVQLSGSGNLYAKQLDLVGWNPTTAAKPTWEYVGKRGLAGLSAATLATLEAAQAFGVEFGICCICGALLTNPESIAAGIGPICGGRFNSDGRQLDEAPAKPRSNGRGRNQRMKYGRTSSGAIVTDTYSKCEDAPCCGCCP